MTTNAPNAPMLRFYPSESGKLYGFTATLISSRMWRERGHLLQPIPGSPWVGAVLHGELTCILACMRDNRDDTIRLRIWRSSNPFTDSIAVVDVQKSGEWKELLRLPMIPELLAIMSEEVADAQACMPRTDAPLPDVIRTAFLADFHKLLNEAAVLLRYAAPGFTGFNETEDERW